MRNTPEDPTQALNPAQPVTPEAIIEVPVEPGPAEPGSGGEDNLESGLSTPAEVGPGIILEPPPLDWLQDDGHTGISRVVNDGLILNLPAFALRLYVGAVKAAEYHVAIGRPGAPTPTGRFTVVSKIVDPWWRPPEEWYPAQERQPVPPGPNNPLGSRWLGITWDGEYGIHGTTNPDSIGGAVSLGCIRLRNHEVEELFDRVEEGWPVVINYQRLELNLKPIQDPALDYPHLAVYPDVYGIQPLDAGLLELFLSARGFGGRYPRALLQRYLHAARKGPVEVPLSVAIRIDGKEKPLQEHGLVRAGAILLPVRAVAEAVGLRVGWDPVTRAVSVGGQALPDNSVVFIEGTSYTGIRELENFFGLKFRIDSPRALVWVQRPRLEVGGTTYPADLGWAGGPTLALRQLAKLLGATVEWDPQAKKVFLNGRAVDLEPVGGKTYVPLSMVEPLFGVRPEWDPDEFLISLDTGSY